MVITDHHRVAYDAFVVYVRYLRSLMSFRNKCILFNAQFEIALPCWLNDIHEGMLAGGCFYGLGRLFCGVGPVLSPSTCQQKQRGLRIRKEFSAQCIIELSVQISCRACTSSRTYGSLTNFKPIQSTSKPRFILGSLEVMASPLTN